MFTPGGLPEVSNYTREENDESLKTPPSNTSHVLVGERATRARAHAHFGPF